MKKRILLIITILIAAFIFIHSSIPAVDSTVESDAAFGVLDRLTALLNLPNLFNAITIRKLAHFAEFAVFGFFLSATVRSYGGSFTRELFKILFFLLAVPVTDETIQFFPEGRSAQVSDVLLDFSGAVFGFLCLALLWAIVTKIHNHNKES